MHSPESRSHTLYIQSNMPTDITQQGLRERPRMKDGKLEVEQPYHMTSVLKRLFPDVEWSHEFLKGGNKQCIRTVASSRISPDFWNIDIELNGKRGIVIEIDGDSKNRSSHFSRAEVALKDQHHNEAYEKFGFGHIIRIPPYIQLDKEMIAYYFGEDVARSINEDLYPAVHEHGFAHPDITLPADYCELGILRFEKDLESIPSSVKNKIISSLRDRVASYQEKGFTHEEALSLVLPKQLYKLLQ